jgi:imidazolonepropionase-like amidohydrolase
LKTGAFADIIAIKQDPLKDIKALENVHWVMKDGVMWKSK